MDNPTRVTKRTAQPDGSFIAAYEAAIAKAHQTCKDAVALRNKTLDAAWADDVTQLYKERDAAVAQAWRTRKEAEAKLKEEA